MEVCSHAVCGNQVKRVVMHMVRTDDDARSLIRCENQQSGVKSHSTREPNSLFNPAVSANQWKSVKLK